MKKNEEIDEDEQSGPYGSVSSQTPSQSQAPTPSARPSVPLQKNAPYPDQEPDSSKYATPEWSGTWSMNSVRNRHIQLAATEKEDETKPKLKEKGIFSRSGSTIQIKSESVALESIIQMRQDRDMQSEEFDEVEIMSNMPQQHKPPASAYRQLGQQETDSSRYQAAYIDPIDEDFVDELEADENPNEKHFPLRTRTKREKSASQNWKKFGKYVYNKDADTYCNRTFTNWCAVCSYYAWLMVAFFGIFMVYIVIFLWRDTENTDPAFLKITVMPDPNPALGLVPLANNSDLIIWYKGGNPKDNANHFDTYVKDIAYFLETQELICNQSKLLKKVCHLDSSEFGPCATPNYGYDENHPCLFLKLNNLISWEPAPYPQDYKFGDELPQSLVAQIRKEAPRHCIYVHCQGVSAYDQEHVGDIDYYPEQAFDGKYFPALRETKTNPLIAVKLKSIHTGYLLQIQCTLLAANIKNRANSVIKLTLYLR